MLGFMSVQQHREEHVVGWCYFNSLCEKSYLHHVLNFLTQRHCTEEPLRLMVSKHTQVWYGTGWETTSIDDPYNPLKKSKGKAEDGLIKHLECICLVILYKNVRGYGTASGLQVRTRPGAFCFSLHYFRKGTQALCGTCRFLEVKKNFVQ